MDRGGKASVKVERSVIAATASVIARPPPSDSLRGEARSISETLLHGIGGTALGFGDVTGAVAGTTISRHDVAFRFLGDGRTVAAVAAHQRPLAGEILTRENILVETPSIETAEPLPLRDCRCESPTDERSSR